MPNHRQPRTVDAATPLCERFADIEAQVALIANARNDAIAGANAAADKRLAPLIEEREQIRSKLEPWWAKAGDKLLDGVKKTLELGGCIIGTRKGKDALGEPSDTKATIVKLETDARCKALVRVTKSIDKPAVAKALDGELADGLKAIGFHTVEGVDEFVLSRAEQNRTRS
jgi:phage host-nuclease inhibitor protein Gam